MVIFCFKILPSKKEKQCLIVPHSFPLGSLVRAHPNQEPIALHQLVKLRPIEQLNLSEAFALDLEEALLGASEGTIETGDDAMECANVLKKRRRRMRGHKHKKRLKERRHKADK